MRHGQVDRARANALGPGARSTRQLHARLGPADDLDLLPGEAHADAERLAHRLLAREPAGVALRRIRPRVAVRPLGLGEAALPEAGIAVERTLHPVDLDHVEADLH